jgi:ankyrin repeat protein
MKLQPRSLRITLMSLSLLLVAGTLSPSAPTEMIPLPDVHYASDQQSEIQTLIRKGDLEGIRAFFEKHPDLINARISYAWGAIHVAAQENKVEVVKLLAELGSSYFLQDWETNSIVIHAAGSDEMLKFVLAQGLDINGLNDYGFAALHNTQSVDAVECLLRFGADINLPATDTRTPLDIAIFHNNEKKTAFLIAHGATVDPDMLVAASGRNGKLGILKALLAKGVKLEAAYDNGENALHRAAKGGNIEILRFLLEQNVLDVNAKDDGGWSALKWVQESIGDEAKKTEAIRILLDAGAKE